MMMTMPSSSSLDAMKMQTFARDRRSVSAYSSSAVFEHEEEEEEEEELILLKSAESEARHYKNMLKDSANRRR